MKKLNRVFALALAMPLFLSLQNCEIVSDLLGGGDNSEFDLSQLTEVGALVEVPSNNFPAIRGRVVDSQGDEAADGLDLDGDNSPDLVYVADTGLLAEGATVAAQGDEFVMFNFYNTDQFLSTEDESHPDNHPMYFVVVDGAPAIASGSPTGDASVQIIVSEGGSISGVDLDGDGAVDYNWLANITPIFFASSGDFETCLEVGSANDQASSAAPINYPGVDYLPFEKQQAIKETRAEECWTGYGPAEESPYVLPVHPNGPFSTILITQGNCMGSDWSHIAGGGSQYAYDFQYTVGAIGDCISAVRAGVVESVTEDIPDVDPDLDSSGPDNNVVVRHADGTYSRYQHMMNNGVIPEVGDTIYQGQAIGWSGHNGYSSAPHLHLIVLDEFYSGIPYNFRNAEQNSTGNILDKPTGDYSSDLDNSYYTALPYEPDQEGFGD